MTRDRMTDQKCDFIVAVLLAALCVLLGHLLSSWASSGEPNLAPAYVTLHNHNFDRLEKIVVVDGDTIKADVYLGRGVLLRNETIRLEGMDAWESKRIRRTVTITDAELRKGKAAADALAGLVRDAPVALLSDGGRDNYGRCLGRLRLVQRDGSVLDAADWMIEHGHDRVTKPNEKHWPKPQGLEDAIFE